MSGRLPRPTWAPLDLVDVWDVCAALTSAGVAWPEGAMRLYLRAHWRAHGALPEEARLVRASGWPRQPVRTWLAHPERWQDPYIEVATITNQTKGRKCA